MDEREMGFLVRFGDVIRAKRRDKGWTQEDLAAESGLHTNQISLVERAGVNASLTIALKIAGALEIKLSELLVVVEDQA